VIVRRNKESRIDLGYFGFILFYATPNALAIFIFPFAFDLISFTNFS